MGSNRRNIAEAIRLDSSPNMRADRAGNRFRIGSAEAIGEVNFLGREIDQHALRLKPFITALKVNVAQFQKFVGVTKPGLQAARRLGAKSEVGQGHSAAKTNLGRVM